MPPLLQYLMRYLVRARVKPGKEARVGSRHREPDAGARSVAGDEYLRNMTDARIRSDGSIRWVEGVFLRDAAGGRAPYGRSILSW